MVIDMFYQPIWFVQMWNKSSWHRQNIQRTILSTKENYLAKYVWETFAFLCFLCVSFFFSFQTQENKLCLKQYSCNSVEISTLNDKHNTDLNDTSFACLSILFVLFEIVNWLFWDFCCDIFDLNVWKLYKMCLFAHWSMFLVKKIVFLPLKFLAFMGSVVFGAYLMVLLCAFISQDGYDWLRYTCTVN